LKDGLGRVRSVLVLGGDSDIAVATTRSLIARGARDIALAGRNLEHLAARAAQLRDAGAERVETALFDADAVESHGRFFEAVFAELGHVDVVLLAFGVLGMQDEAERDATAAVAVVRTNFLGATSAAIHAAERLRKQGQGTLVVFSSVAAQRPRRSNFVYGASKAGLDALSEGLAFALRDQGVQVLTVRPGFVTTKMTAGMHRAPFSTTPEKVAEATVAAIASGAELIWVPGILRHVMWAMKLVPRPIFRRLKV
jgi:decaprenylphospho-beta-D-erythro-pentofuranosid-2-ulose 2-reductase